MANDAEMVFLAADNPSASQRLHLDEDCRRFKQQTTVVERPREMYPSREICKVCSGEAEKVGSGPTDAYLAAMEAGDD